MRVRAYIDGFNLYNGAVRKTAFKWLDLNALCCKLVKPADTLEGIKYFSARVSARATDPDEPVRQQVYWRALRTLPDLEIIEGHFLMKPVSLPTVKSVDAMTNGIGRNLDFVQVYRSEEKGTDVNLAVHLVNDAHRDRYDAAMVISNDSDLCEAIRVVTAELGKVAFVASPHAKSPSVELRNVASYFFSIKKAAIRDSQFPDPLLDADGRFSKPRTW